MKYFFFLFMPLFILFGNHIKAQSDVKFKYTTIIETDKGSKLLNQPSRKTPKYISNYYIPEKGEIKQLEVNFNRIKSLRAGKKQIKNLNKYAYQYIGIVIDGNKYIYINAFDISAFESFPTWEKTWKKEPIRMYDGGDSFWGAVYDLKNNRFSQLFFNHKVRSF